MPDAATQEKYAFKMQLLPGKADEYRRRHDAIWPELAALLNQAGVSDYSIHLDHETSVLFGVLTRRQDHTMTSLPDHPVMKKWWAHMADIMATNLDNSPVQSDLVTIFPHAMNDMPKYSRIAVLDIGKTNAKLVVVDSATGAEIAAARMANTVVRFGLYPHYDIEALWSFSLEALRTFAKSPGFDAISITTHGASAALLGADGKLAMPVIDYEHEYPKDIRDAYTALRPPFEETYSPRQSMGLNVGAQIHYQKTAFPAEFAKVATILTYPQYWQHS